MKQISVAMDLNEHMKKLAGSKVAEVTQQLGKAAVGTVIVQPEVAVGMQENDRKRRRRAPPSNPLPDLAPVPVLTDAPVQQASVPSATAAEPAPLIQASVSLATAAAPAGGDEEALVASTEAAAAGDDDISAETQQESGARTS